MKPIKIEKICNVINGSASGGDLGKEITGVKIDTRQIKAGDLFVALPGEKTDGHLHLKSAKEGGASAALCQQPVDPIEGLTIIQVDDTIKALQRLASYYRALFDVPVIALTGSSGKTTTKNILVEVLSQKYKTIGTRGNKNNHIGMPLMVFDMDDDTEVAVFEMGMSGFGEIETLVQIAKPDYAIITNIGTAHMEQLGSRENILKAKAEILSTLGPDQTALVNGDDPYLRQLPPGKYHACLFGLEGEDLDWTCTSYEMDAISLTMTVREKDQDQEDIYFFTLPGRHNVYNCLVGIAIGRMMGLSKEEIQTGLNAFVPMDNRMEIQTMGSRILIDDSYNANPQSMESALDVLALYKGPAPTIAILGDMLEMGPEGPDYHRKVGAYLADQGIDYLFAYGQAALYYVEGALTLGLKSDHAKYFSTRDDLLKSLLPFWRQAGVFLVKGSRGMKLDEVVKIMKEKEE
ncbi:UDP-N-acetylmuramoyl-tripeptide--D-alanyl-D-alanine ligase [Alkalibacter rhizosphaerae]|uniref:UDP-N-acetylmuramoyl-tripeptide--D-alanyl-D-alanine ligase n=1 Tax=Alkalibacter rhizosphaerae TaxID=2815577 RepID=A0A974XFL2_9FIRM|nr:UDP-N-acetylmuramoyl-tripeptide--D-alanyl-D-alanine ligase [Alkalibacter rhizosphaerae]QSX08923.1 UDP-N-acetylmuramoyl-tripeptide--D-alanyl-D-alanine ligase [Alkalibacter rhizosphaerae]